MMVKEEKEKPVEEESEAEKEIERLLGLKPGEEPELPERLNGTTYYKSIDNKGRIRNIYRIILDEEKKEMFNEAYDKWNDTWYDYPDVVRYIAGLDDDNKYIPTGEKEAIDFIKYMKEDGAARKVERTEKTGKFTGEYEIFTSEEEYSKAYPTGESTHMKRGYFLGEGGSQKDTHIMASGYFDLGLTYHWQKKYEEALQNFLKAVELVPNDAEYWDLLGNAYLNLKQLDEAQKALEKAIEVNPGYSLAYYDLGVVFSRMSGREKEAMKVFKQAIKLNPDLKWPYYAISCLYSLQNRRKSSLNYLRKAIQKGFNDRKYLDNDHDFDNLRDDDEFQKIIKNLG
jgi:tetratricopeptide (TPR) repeat protein